MDYQESGVGNKKVQVPVILGKASNFEYEAPIVTEATQVESFEVSASLSGTVNDSGPFEFTFEPMGDSYLQMGSIVLHCVVSVNKDDEDAANRVIKADEEAGLINMIGSTMWETIETRLNDFNFPGQSASNSHYKSYLQTVLSYNNNALQGHLACQLTAMDTAGKMDVTGTGNVGFTARALKTQMGKRYDLVTPPCADFVKANNHLAPGNKLSMKFFRAGDAFCLMRDAALVPHLKIHELKLYANRIRLSEEVPRPLSERYLYSEVHCRKYPIPTRTEYYSIPIHLGGVMPKHLVMGFVETSAVEGNYDKNPFNFQRFDLKEHNLRVNGKCVPTTPLRPSQSHETGAAGAKVIKYTHAREYMHMLTNCGQFRSDRGNLITREMWEAGGYALYAYDFSPDKCNGYHLHEGKPGVISADVTWAKELQVPVTAIVMLSFDTFSGLEADSMGFSAERI